MIKKIKNGFTLVEVLIVLGIASVIVAGVYITYSIVRSGNQANEEVRNMIVLRENIKKMFSMQGTYSGLNTALVAKSGFVPSNIKTDGTNLSNVWGNNYTISPVQISTPGGTFTNLFRVQSIVPKNACEKVVQGLTSWDALSISSGATEYNVKIPGDDTVYASNILSGCGANSSTATIFATSQ